jgi:hypothetical protein
MGSNTLSMIKKDSSNQVVDLAADVTFNVDVRCDLMPYKIVDPHHSAIVAIDF